jgi:MFS family permease
MGALGLLLGIATTNFFNAHIFPSWSWRIPFVLSLPLSFVSLYFRSKMIDPDIFIKCSNPAHSIISIIKKRWLIICLIILFAGSVGAMYQIGVILMRHYLPIVLPSSQSVISVFSIIGVLCFAIAMPCKSGYFL